MMSINSKTFKIIWRALLVGIATSLVVSVFRELVKLMFSGLLMIYSRGWNWQLILVMLIFSGLLGLLIGTIINRYRAVKGSGIPQAEAEMTGRRDYAWLPCLALKMLVSTLTVGSGVFMGHEGPSIQLGGSVGHGVAALTHQDHRIQRLLVASGAAAGLTAVFNTPLASSFFVMETVYASLAPQLMMTVVLSALTSDFVSMLFFGTQPFLNLHQIPKLPLKFYPELIILGILLGILGLIFKKLMLNPPHWANYFHRFGSIAPVIPLMLVVPLGIANAKLIGTGSQLILFASRISLPLWIIIFYFLARFSTVWLAFTSGLPGGIFLPILTLGALIGDFCAQGLVEIGWLPAGELVVFISAAMGGYFACIAKAPLTAIMLITEMVGSFRPILPLILVTIVADLTDGCFHGQPIYRVMLNRLLKSN